MNNMIIGHNNQFPYVATAHEDEYPIVHVALRSSDIENSDKRKYFLEFIIFADYSQQKDKVEYLKGELMKFVADETNLKLPYYIDGKYYKFSNNHIIPNSKYSLLPIGNELS